MAGCIVVGSCAPLITQLFVSQAVIELSEGSSHVSGALSELLWRFSSLRDENRRRISAWGLVNCGLTAPPSPRYPPLSRCLSLCPSLVVRKLHSVCGKVVFICVCSIARTGC